MALLQYKVSRRLVGEKFGAMTQDEIIHLQHRPLPRSVVLRRVVGKGEAVGARKLLKPVKSPLNRAHDTVGVTGGKSSLPTVHPTPVKLAQPAQEALCACWRNCSTTADMSSSPSPAVMACSKTRSAARPISRSRACWSASAMA